MAAGTATAVRGPARGVAVFSSTAVVVTDASARYAKQLVSHLGRRVDFTTDGDTSTATFGEGTGAVVVGEGADEVLAEAEAMLLDEALA